MKSPKRPLSRKQVLELLRRGKSLEQADIRGLDLSGLCFDGVNLRWTKLADANLARCSFRGADLTSASMWHANLKDAIFDEAVLDGADLDCANIDGCTFKDARIRKTIFPIPRDQMGQVMESIRLGTRIRVEREDFAEEA
ncbi:MAG: pentapeptide repeat-containing protein [Alphaproteobacteria bacterium]|nr:pentapeptide repeat-containing protein [Alphaproteobacteria bacterium]